MYDNPNQPHVLLGTRSLARGRRIEAALSGDPRIILLGVHTESEALLRALSASPSAVLVIDSALTDCSAHAALYRTALRRPCHAIALASANSGEFAVEAMRAGALDCILWAPDHEPARDLAERVLLAAQQPPITFQLMSKRPGHEPRQRLEGTRFSSGRLLILVGERRGTLLCDAAEHLPPQFTGSVLAYRPIHNSMRSPFAAHLARQSSIQISTPSDGDPVLDGTAYLFSRRLGLQLDPDSKTEKLKFKTSAATSNTNWTHQVVEGVSQGVLSAIVIGWGHQTDQERAFAAALARKGAAVAKKVAGGYHIRWPHLTESVAFADPLFWDHLARNLVSHGANVTQTSAAAPIWPVSERAAGSNEGAQ